MIYLIIYLILGLVSAVIVYGAVLGYFVREYPELDNYKTSRETALVGALLTLICWPFMLTNELLNNHFKHGLLFTNPHKKKDMITKCEKCNCYSCRCQQIDFISKPKEQRCAECGGMFLQDKMHLETIYIQFGLNDKNKLGINWRCKQDALPYDQKVHYKDEVTRYFKTIPAHEVEVDVNGVEVKKTTNPKKV